MQAYNNDSRDKHFLLEQLSSRSYTIQRREFDQGGPLTYTCVYCPIMALLKTPNGAGSRKHPSYQQFEKETGIPAVLGCINCFAFAFLDQSKSEGIAWAQRYFEQIPVGADLSNVWGDLVQWMLMDNECGVIRYAATSHQKWLIENVAQFYREKESQDAQSAAVLAAIVYGEYQEMCPEPDKELGPEYFAIRLTYDVINVVAEASDFSESSVLNAGFSVIHYPDVLEATIQYDNASSRIQTSAEKKKLYNQGLRLVTEKVISLMSECKA